MRATRRAPVRGAIGAALALALLLCQGFDWPGRAERLVNVLTSATSPRDRRDALRLLGELAARSPLPAALDLSAVEAASHNVDPDVRAEAWSLLARLRRAPDGLEIALRDSAQVVRLVALRELLRLAPDHDDLLRAVTDPDATVRAAGVEALALRGDPRAVPLLASALRDASIEVRVAAVRALGQRREPGAQARIASAADDPLPEVRAAGLDTLLSVRAGEGAGEGAAAVGSALTICQRALDDTDQAVLLASLRCLERARHGSAAPEVLALVAHDPRVVALARSYVPIVASAAARLLALSELRAGAPSAAPAPDWLPLLERTAERALGTAEATQIVAALEASVPTGEALVADPLLEWLPRAPSALRPRVAALIERAHAELAAPPVLALLDDVPPAERAPYLRLLAWTRGADTDARLLASLDDPRPALREAALFAGARALGEDSLPRLLTRLDATPPAQRHDTLEVLAALLERLRRARRAVSPGTGQKLVRALEHDLAQRDETNAALAVRALGALDSERARAAVRAVLGDARPGRAIAALHASTRDHGVEARQQRRLLLGHPDAPVAASALVAVTLADDPLPTTLALDWLRDAAWPRGPAASFALLRGVLRQDASTASFAPCTWLARDEPITHNNMLAALQHRPADACAAAEPSAPRAQRLPQTASARRPDEPAALILQDSSMIVSVPDASGWVGWPELEVVREVSAFLPGDQGL